MNELVVSSLQKGRIDCDDRFESFTGQSGGKCNGMLLCNTHIEKTIRIIFCKLNHSRSFAHGRGDSDQFAVGRGHIAQPVTEDIGISRFQAGRWFYPFFRTELSETVVQDRIRFSQFVAMSFFGNDMKELGACTLFQVFQSRNQQFHIMTINGSYIVESEFLEKSCRRDQSFCMFFEPPGKFEYGATQNGFSNIFCRSIKLAGH